jgi:hypothetical protein
MTSLLGEGEFWAQAQWTEPPTNEKTVLGTLVAADDGEKLHVLGNAFVIRDNGSNAICMTAAHSFDHAKRFQRERTKYSHPSMPPDFRPMGPEYVRTEGIFAVFVVDDEPMCCNVGQLNYIDGYDVAVFTAHAPQSRRIFRYRLAIDLRPPEKGEEVGLLAYATELEHYDYGAGRISQNILLRAGTVLDPAEESYLIAGQSFCFRTTIPVVPGMSGAPVVSKLTLGNATIVRRVVSSDFSDPVAFTDCKIPGCSTASALWPAMGLGFTLSLEGESGPARQRFLGELLDMKLLDDRSKDLSVRVRQPETMTEILFTDQREQPPRQVLLTTTGQPNVRPAS